MTATATEPHLTLVYKICRAQAWADAAHRGTFLGSAIDLQDGYIHLSSHLQVVDTAKRHFRGQADLVLVAFDAATLAPELRWEASRGGDMFPHVYGPLPTAKAVWIRPMPLDASGIPHSIGGLR
jgi:uncharacterized protein (DUF952 family)